MRGKLLFILLVLILVGHVAASGRLAGRAEDVELTILPSVGTGRQGSTVTFRATVKNLSGQAINLNQLSLAFAGTDLLNGDPTEFYTNFTGTLAAGAQISDKVLFTVEVPSNTPLGTYTGTVAVLGGANANVLTNLAQQDFQIKVIAGDTASPDTAITAGPGEGETVCGTSTTFSFLGTDNETRTDGMRYRWRLDGGTWQGPITTNSATLNTLTNGSHLFEVAAVDEANNIDATPAVRNFFVDGTPLTVSNVRTSGVGPVSATVLWNTSTRATSQVDYRRASDTTWQSTPEDPTLVTSHRVVLSGLIPATAYVYRVRSKDACGEAIVSAEQTFSTPADSTPPDTSFTSGPENNGKACEANVQFCWTAVDNATPTPLLQYAYKLDSGDWSGWNAETCHIFNNLSEGLHTVQVRARDTYGNTELSPAVRNFFVDLTPPAFTTLDATPRDYRVIVTLNTSEPTTAVVEYGPTTSYGSTVSSSVSSGSHRLVLTGLTPQTQYHYHVKINDGCREIASEDRTVTTTEILKPNLWISEVTAPASVKALENITLSWRTQNSGPGDVRQASADSLYLSSDTTVSLDDTLLRKIDAPRMLGELEDYSQTITLQVPPRPAGNYYLLVRADVDDTVAETTESDNVFAKQVEYLKTSDLVAVPDQISMSLHPGTPVQKELQLGNLKTAPLTGLTFTVENSTPNVHVQVDLPASIEGLHMVRLLAL